MSRFIQIMVFQSQKVEPIFSIIKCNIPVYIAYLLGDVPLVPIMPVWFSYLVMSELCLSFTYMMPHEQ